MREDVKNRVLEVRDCAIFCFPEHLCPHCGEDCDIEENDKRYFVCALQEHKRVLIDDEGYDGDDDEFGEHACEWDARAELFGTCPLPKASEKEGGE